MYPLFRFCKDLRRHLSPIIPYLNVFPQNFVCTLIFLTPQMWHVIIVLPSLYVFGIIHKYFTFLTHYSFLHPGSFSFFLKYVIKNLGKNLFVINSCHFSFVWKFFILKFWKILPLFHPYSWKYFNLVCVCNCFLFLCIEVTHACGFKGQIALKSICNKYSCSHTHACLFSSDSISKINGSSFSLRLLHIPVIFLCDA